MYANSKGMNHIEEMLRTLKQNPNVAGLLEYGGGAAGDAPASGDYDLVVIQQDRNPAVTSLHFDVGDVPVDLNLLSLQELRQLAPDDSFEAQIIVTGRALYDPTGELRKQQERLQQALVARPIRPWSEHTIAFIRHGHRHLLDKVQDRLHSMPTLCQLLLHTNIYWLLENYFRLRYLPFRGAKQALSYLQAHDEELYNLIETFYATTSLKEKAALSHQMSEIVLEPVGGMWRKGEILAFGREESQELQQQGQAAYAELFRPVGRF